MIEDRFTPDNHKVHICKDGTLYLLDHIVNQGGMLTREYDVTVSDMQSNCIYHSKICRMQDMGKSITMYVNKDTTQVVQHCTYHAFVHAFQKFTLQGDEVLNRWHP